MLILDIEATGLNPHKHSILEIGAIEFEHPENRFEGVCCAWDGAHFEDEALEIVGMTKAEASDATKESEADLVKRFFVWAQKIDDRTIVGQNPGALDMAILEAAAGRAHVQFPFAHRSIDLHSVAWTHMVLNGKTPPIDKEKHHSALNLSAILEYVGLPMEPKPHRAMTGTLLEAEALSRLLRGKPLLEEYKKFEMV